MPGGAREGAAGVVVLGLGNLLRRDDGVGVHVIQELRTRHRFPPSVRLVDGGLGGPGLLGVVEGAGALIIVDAVHGGEPPGTLYRIPGRDLLEGELGEAGSRRGRAGAVPGLSLHEDGPEALLSLAYRDNPALEAVVLGVEPMETEGWGMELSPPVAASVPILVELVLRELASLGVQVGGR